VTHARRQHPNARLIPRQWLNRVACAIGKGWSIEATAERFQVDAQTVRKWVARVCPESESGVTTNASKANASRTITSSGSPYSSSGLLAPRVMRPVSSVTTPDEVVTIVRARARKRDKSSSAQWRRDRPT
jgi:hypothetical protein